MYVSPTLVRLPNAPAPRRSRYLYVAAVLVMGGALYMAACAEHGTQPNRTVPSQLVVAHDVPGFAAPGSGIEREIGPLKTF